MRTDFTGAYPADWKSIAAAVKESAGWRCARCGHEHDPATGRTLTVLCRLLFPAIFNVGARFALSPLVLIASVAQSLAEWLDQPPAVLAQLRRLLDLTVAMRQELIHATVCDHVAATAENGDVFGLIVAGVCVFVVSLGGGFAASLALSKRVPSLRSGALGFRSGIITFPIRMHRAAQHTDFSSIFTIGAWRSVFALVSVAVRAEAVA